MDVLKYLHTSAIFALRVDDALDTFDAALPSLAMLRAGDTDRGRSM